MTLTLPPIAPSASPAVRPVRRTLARTPLRAACCDRCRTAVRTGSLTAYAGEQLCATCLVRVRDLTCRYCGQLKSADPRRELCDSCVDHGFGSY